MHFREWFVTRGTIKCWFPSSSSSRLLWTQLNVPYNYSFIYNVYLPCTSHKVLLNHYAAFCLDKFWATERLPIKGTSSHKCHLPFTDSIVLLKQKRSKVMIAKPAKTLIISFNNNTPLVESKPWKGVVR